jgi:dihydrofolate reductase
VALDGVIEN